MNPNEKLNAKAWRVMPTDIYTARNLVKQYHYSGDCSLALTFCFGLFSLSDPIPKGVSVWIPAAKGSVDKYKSDDHSITYASSLTLSRLVIVPDAPKNAASFLLGRSIRLIKQDGRFNFLITYADTFRDHDGGIYKATNWIYQGLTSDNRLFKMPDGTIKSRGKHHTGNGTKADMEAKGAIFLGNFPKHAFTMKLKPHDRPEKPKQLEMFGA